MNDFQPHFRKSPVTDAWEPLYSRRRTDGVDLQFDVAGAHCNSRGFLHGGVLAALCDNAMGLSLGTQLGAGDNIVTIGLSLDYLGSARVGERVTIEPRVLRAGGSVGFCDALVKVADRTIARANASFSVRASAS
jgi:uncharacterized protein (TIGR00369 family)